MSHSSRKPIGINPPTPRSPSTDAASSGAVHEAGHAGRAPGQGPVDEHAAKVHPGILTGTLNTRFLVLSASIVLGAVGVLVLTHYVQQNRLTGDLLALAEAAAEHDPQLAQRRYRDYLNLRHDDLNAQIELAELQMQTAETPSQWHAAFRTNEAILRTDTDYPDIRRRQVDICFRLGRFKEAREHLERLVESSPKDGALHMLLGVALEADQQYRAAAREFGLAIEDENFQSFEVTGQKWTSIQAYAKRASLLHDELNDTNGADRVFRSLVAKHPSSSEAFLMRARHRSRTGETTDAVADAKKACELDPGSLDALLLTAELMLAEPTVSQHDLDSVHEKLKAAVADFPDDATRPYLLLARLDQRRGDGANVVATLEEGVKHTAEDSELNSALIGHLIAQGRADEARVRLEQQNASAQSKSDPDSLYLAGGILLNEGQPAEAMKKFQQARTSAVTNHRIYLLASVQIANCWLAMGSPHEALREFNNVVRLDPSSAEARAGLAAAQASSGNAVAAVRTLRKLPLDSPSAALELARLEFGVAMQQLPDRRNWGPVQTALEAANGFAPDSNDVSLLQSMMLAATGKRAEAKRILEVAAGRGPVHVGIIGALAQMAYADGDLEGAQTLLDNAATQLTNSAELDLYRLAFWKSANPDQFEQALNEFETKEYPADSTNRYRLLESIAAWHSNAGHRNRALNILLKAAEQRGDHVDSWLRLMGTALDLKRDDVRDRAMSELRRVVGDDDVRVKFAKAMLLASESTDDVASAKRDQAYRLLQQIVEERSDWAPPYVLLGRIDLLRGKRGDAAEWYRLAVLHGDRDPANLRLTTQLLLDQMKTQEAMELFEEVRRTSVGTLRGTTTELMAQIFTAQDRGNDILRLVREDLASDVAGSMDRIRRGQMLWMSGDHAAAETEFRNAVEQEPTDANGWLALVSFLVRRDDAAGAAKVVSQAETTLAESGNLVALARCLEMVGRTEDAEQQLVEVVQAEPNNGAVRYSLASFYVRNSRWQEADQLIDPILKNFEAFTGVDRLSVRRLKAASIAFTSFAGYEQALELLATNIREAVDRSTDQRLRARLLLSHKHPKYVRDGLRLFGTVGRKLALSAEEKMNVAQALDRLRKDKAADDQWDELLTDHSRNSKVIEGYMRRQLKRGELNGLRTYIRQLELSRPDSWSTVELSTNLDLQEKKIDSAVKVIDRYIARAQDPAERTSRMKQCAGSLAGLASSPRISSQTELAAFHKAAELYQELMEKDEESVVTYAQHIARHGRIEQALDLLEKTENAIPGPLRAAYGVQIVKHASHEDPQVARVHQWISELRQQAPDSLRIVHLEEAICVRRQQYDKAIELNRLVLRKFPEQVASLNNLAWLLGTQKDDYQTALDLLDTAVKVAGPASFLLDTRGQVLLEAGRLESAIEDFETAWLQDNQPTTQFHLALALSRFGDRDAAREHLREALLAGLRPPMLEGREVAVFEELQDELGLIPDSKKG